MEALFVLTLIGGFSTFVLTYTYNLKRTIQRHILEKEILYAYYLIMDVFENYPMDFVDEISNIYSFHNDVISVKYNEDNFELVFPCNYTKTVTDEYRAAEIKLSLPKEVEQISTNKYKEVTRKIKVYE